MPARDITSSDFETLIGEHELVFIDFWAPWCAPCKQFSAAFEQAAALFPMIQFAKVNIEQEQEFADIFEIRSIPHLMVFKEGIAIYSDAGNMPLSALKELAQQALDVDVSDIKSQIEKTKENE